MPIKALPIIGPFDVQRFKQFGPEDCANWSMVPVESGKKKIAMYPMPGRRHVNYLGQNKLIFQNESRGLFKSINYWYVVVDNNIYRVDSQYSILKLTNGSNLLETRTGNIFCTFLVAINITFVVFVDGQKIYVYVEPNTTNMPATGLYTLSGEGVPVNPTFVATFGNRIVVSNAGSSQFNLSKIFLGGNNFDPTNAFNIPPGGAVFAQEEGIIRQFGVLNNTLYIFTDYNVGIWADNPSNLVPAGDLPAVTFPWKKSSTYAWNFGMADPLSLDIAFNVMVWLGKNKDGLVQVMASNGGLPKPLSSKAVNVLFQNYVNSNTLNPIQANSSNGFLYQYENNIYYKLSFGNYKDTGLLDQTQNGNALEYNFETETWTRCIELNGEMSRIRKHVFFNNKHFISIEDNKTVYEMSGSFYDNEIENPDSTNLYANNAYLSFPMRYEKITKIIAEDDYSEFITDYVQIDFVFGVNTFNYSNNPFENAVFIVAEQPDVNGDPVFIVSETDPETFVIMDNSNYTTANSAIYNQLFKPHVELYYSDDGGIGFLPADVREFSQLGVYQWRMRWYQLGPSRNRVYKLICVSPAPIVILGGVMDVRRASGGAN